MLLRRKDAKTARDELAAVVSGWANDYNYEIADAIIAAGWTPPEVVMAEEAVTVRVMGTFGQATVSVIDGLARIANPHTREAAGVALFGTAWEDAGSRAILALARH